MNYISRYIQFLTQSFSLSRPLRVVVDCSNGTTGPIIDRLLKASKLITYQLINASPDGNFPAHGPDPLRRGAFRQLRDAVLRAGADIGIIFDVDGDRVFFLDNQGRAVDSDAVLRLFIWYLRPRAVALTPGAGWLLRRSSEYVIKSIKEEKKDSSLPIIYESPVGHYFIKKLMREQQIELGGERAGHYYFKDFFYADSGILAAIYALNAISRMPYRLSHFVDFLPRYARSEEINIMLRTPDISPLLTSLESHLNNGTPTISRIDGLRMEFEDWWFSARVSNTEPLIRLNIESVSKNLLKEKIKEITSFLNPKS